jgi:hypothetical protein
MDAHHRAGADHVIAAVHAKGLQGGGAVGASLQLVKEKERFSRNEFQIRIFQRYVLDDRINLKAVVEDIRILLLKNEVDFYYVFIIVFCEMSDRFGFSDLPRALNDERHMRGIRFPFDQKRIYFSF